MIRTRDQLSTVRSLTVGGLAVAAAGIVVQIAGGADYPAVPPGALLLVASAALFAIPGRWTSLLAVLVPIFLSIGGILTPNMSEQLGAPSETVTFAGTAIQLAGLAVGLVGGLIVVAQSLRTEARR